MLRKDPQLAREDVPIAEAARGAGFDCSQWPKLANLIDAVKIAAFPRRRPPPYRSFRPPPRYRSSIYPDRWRPDTIRPRKSVVDGYREASSVPTVPAFGRSIDQVLRDITNAAQNQREDSPATLLENNIDKPVTGAFQSSTFKPGGKRGALLDAAQRESTFNKRLKTEGPLQSARSVRLGTEIIDLTQARSYDDEPTTRGATVNYGHDAGRPHRSLPKRTIRHDTNAILSRCAGRLKAILHGIDTDR